MSGLEAIVAAVAGTALGEIAKNEINRQPPKTLKEVVQDVDDLIDKLEVMIKGCDEEIKRNKLMKPSENFKLWNDKFFKFREDVAALKSEYKDKINKFLNPSRRETYRKEMLSSSLLAKELLEWGRDFNIHPRTLLVAPLPKPVEKQTNAPDIKLFPSLQNPLEEALHSLRPNKANKVITIVGTLGVGKTSVLQNLNNHKKVADLFDIVIFLKISAWKNEETLRQEIAQRLNIDDQRGISAVSIAEALKEDKCLLLLDDVTKRLDLSQIGVPDNNAGSKVVLTSRSAHVCRSMSNVRMIKVERLSLDEAWKMFGDMISNVIDLPGIRSLAEQVVEQCDGLPFLIKAVASIFKWKENARLWRDALSDLRCLDTKMEIEGVLEVYEFLASCYGTLKNDEMKKNCFFYAALFPAGGKICANHLLESWREEGFFDSLSYGAKTYQARLDKGHAVLEELVKVSLLDRDENDKKMKRVYMHNCIQEFALYESSKYPESKFLVNKSKSSVEARVMEEWEKAIRISMIDAKLERLPETPNCSMLLTLLLQKNSGLEAISPSFFDRASSLQLLDLHATKVRSLPLSISNMTAMKALYLNGCSSLQDLPGEIANLKFLQVLDIRGTGIAFIPLILADLVSLKILRMSYNYKHDHGRNGRDVVSRLVLLEELVIEVFSNNEWCDEVSDVINAVVDLENLSSLRFSFPAIDSLRVRDLSSFRLFVGCPFSRSCDILERLDFTVDRYLRYCGGELKDNVIIHSLISQSQALELIDHRDITRLSNLGRDGDFRELHGLLISECHKLVSIVDNIDIQDGETLPIPQQLYLNELQCLKSVFEGNKRLVCLSRLKLVELKNCPSLIMVFSEEIADQLTGLKELTIEDCGAIEDLNMEPKGAGLSSLQTLRLHKLPRLKTICIDHTLVWPALEVLEVQECPEMKSLTFNKDNAPKLSLIEGEKVWWDTLHDVEVKKQLGRLCSLKLF